VNAAQRAKDAGIYLEETVAPEAREYTSLMTIEARSVSKVRKAAGTVFGGDQPRLVRVDDLPIDIIPEGHMLVLTNLDRPGVIGFLGTLLGEADINIAGFELGRKVQGGEAISVLTVDNPVPPDVLAKIKTHPAILAVQMVRL
jgi:D-3-phosphoglycerate dehydrogenase